VATVPRAALSGMSCTLLSAALEAGGISIVWSMPLWFICFGLFVVSPTLRLEQWKGVDFSPHTGLPKTAEGEASFRAALARFVAFAVASAIALALWTAIQ